MRLISQDGTIDVPYEQVVIQRYEKNIYFLNKNLTGVMELINDMKIATYSTEQKAIKAMETLRESYACYHTYELMNPEQRAMIVNILSEKDFAVTHGFFIFPKDEEIEN